MRTETCLTCDEPFAPIPRHPMVESAWCADCWRAIEERFIVKVMEFPSPVPAMNAEDV